MNPDENWKETKIFIRDVSDLSGYSEQEVESILKLLENLIVHRLVETIKSSEDSPQGKSFSVELPYLGSLIVDMKGKSRGVSVSFASRPSFYRKLRKACHSQESPLVEQMSEDLSKYLVEQLEVE